MLSLHWFPLLAALASSVPALARDGLTFQSSRDGAGTKPAYIPPAEWQEMADMDLAGVTLWDSELPTWQRMAPVEVEEPKPKFWQPAFWNGRKKTFRMDMNMPPPAQDLDLSKYTIGQILNWTLHHRDEPHTLPLHRLAWLVNVSDPVREGLHEKDAHLTLFAPDDAALTPPHRRKHHGLTDDLSATGLDMDANPDHPFWEAASTLQAESCPHFIKEMREKGDSEDDERREKRRRIFKFIVTMVLKYHVSPRVTSREELIDSSTVGTALGISRGKDAPAFRIRVGEPALLPPGQVKLNFLSVLQPRRVLAKNGVIYIISRAPLLPPLSPLAQLFLFPGFTSTLTSGIQKAGLDEPLLPHWGNKTIPLAAAAEMLGKEEDQVDEYVMATLQDLAKEKHDFTKLTYTIFAPTNKAFAKLGFGINAFLFSPWGTRLLRYALSYHVVPNLVFHTDHVDNSSAKAYEVSSEQNVDWVGSCGRPVEGKVNVTRYLLPTLLGSRPNESLAVGVVQYRLRFGHGPLVRRLVVREPSFNGKPGRDIADIIADGVAWGGAIHATATLIRPPMHEHHHLHGDGERRIAEMWDRTVDPWSYA